MPDLIAALLPFVGFMLVLLVGVALVSLFAPKRKAVNRFPYQKQNNLFTAAEWSFLSVLQQAVGDQYVVFGKVRLADVIKVNGELVRSAQLSAFNRIQGKWLDYVVCGAEDLSIQFVVELDDRSRAQSGREDQGVFIDQALKAAAVKYFRLPAKRTYSVQELNSCLFHQDSEICNADLR